MLSTVEVPESLEKRYESNKQLGHKIAEALEGTGEEKTLTADVDLLAGDEPVYVYVRGSAYFKFYHGGRLLRMYSWETLFRRGRASPEHRPRSSAISPPM